MKLSIITLFACICFASAQLNIQQIQQQIQQQLIQQAIANAPGALDKMNTLLNKFPEGTPMHTTIANLIAQTEALVAQHSGARFLPQPVINWLENIFGLTGIADQLNALTGGLKDSFFGTLEQLLSAGTKAWGQALVVLKNLVASLKDHSLDGVDAIVKPAIAQLQAIVFDAIKGRSLSAEPRFIPTIVNAIEKFFGIEDLAGTISELSGSIQDQFLGYLRDIIFAGQKAWGQALVVLGELKDKLADHSVASGPLFQQAIQALKDIVDDAVSGNQKDSRVQQRFLIPFLENIFGIDDLKGTISELSGNIQDSFFSLLNQAVWKGTKVWGQVLEVLKELKDEVFTHTGNSAPFFVEAIDKLKEILGQTINGRAAAPQERFVIDLLEKIFGLEDVKGQLAAAASGAQAQFFELLNQVRETGLKAIVQASGVLGQLVKDLQAHATNATPYLEKAIAALKEILVENINKPSSRSQVPRGPLEWLEGLFGLGSIKDAINNAGAALKEEVTVVLEGLLTAGKGVLAQAQPILVDLVEQVKEHAGNATPIIQDHFDQLLDILGDAKDSIVVGKRGLSDENKDKILAALEKLENIKNPIIQQLVANLKDKLSQ